MTVCAAMEEELYCTFFRQMSKFENDIDIYWYLYILFSKTI